MTYNTILVSSVEHNASTFEYIVNWSQVSDPLSTKLQNIQYNITDYSHHAVHYISMTFFMFNSISHGIFTFRMKDCTSWPLSPIFPTPTSNCLPSGYHPVLCIKEFYFVFFICFIFYFILFIYFSFVLFLNQPRWLIFPVLDSRTKIPIQGLSPSTLREDLRVCDSPLLFWVTHRGVGLTWKSLLPSYQAPCGSFFIILVVEELFCQSSCHSERELLYI